MVRPLSISCWQSYVRADSVVGGAAIVHFVGLARNRHLGAGRWVVAHSWSLYRSQPCWYPRYVLRVSPLVASVDPGVATQTINAVAGIMVAVIGAVAAWLTTRHAARQKARADSEAIEKKEVIDRDELRTRADTAEIKAREQLWSSMIDELHRMKIDNEEVRNRLRLAEEDHLKERNRLWSYSRRQEVSIKECEERSLVQALEIASLKADLAKYIKNSC